MTFYWVDLHFTFSGTIKRLEFDTMTERALAIVGYSAYTTVVAAGISERGPE